MNMEPLQEGNEIRIHVGITPRNPYPLEDARNAVFGYLISRCKNCQLIVTLQDLENECSSDTRNALHSLFRWLGIEFDEGPFNASESGQFKQSQRISIYRDFLLKLLQEEKAYLVPFDDKKNFDIFNNPGTKEKSQSLKENYSREFSMNHLKNGEISRFEVFLDTNEKEPVSSKHDVFVSPPAKIKLWNFNDKPTTCFANSVDRYLMRITHTVCSGNLEAECLAESLISGGFGGLPVQYIVLSKINYEQENFAKNLKPLPRSIDEIQRLGYLPQVLLHYLGQGSDKISLNKGSVIQHLNCQANFDVDYLNQLGLAELQKCDTESIFRLVKPYLKLLQVPLDNEQRLKKVLTLLTGHCYSLSHIAEEVTVFFNNQPLHYSAFARSVLRRDGSQKVLWSFLRRAKEVEYMTKEVFFSIMKNIQHETGIIGKDLWSPVRIALTGHENPYELASVAEILGKDVCVLRIKTIVGNFW